MLFKVVLFSLLCILLYYCIRCLFSQAIFPEQQVWLPLGMAGARFFYRPDALPVTQPPTVSKHWRKIHCYATLCD